MEVVETGYQAFFVWEDWALPLRITYEAVNGAIEIQILCLFLVFWRRKINEFSTPNINLYSNEDEEYESN